MIPFFSRLAAMLRPAKRRDRTVFVEMEFDAGHRSRWSGHGDHRIDLAYAPPPGADEGALFARSNTLHLTIADASLIARSWGRRPKACQPMSRSTTTRTLSAKTYPCTLLWKTSSRRSSFMGWRTNALVSCGSMCGVSEGCPLVGWPGTSPGFVWAVMLGGLVDYPRGKVVTRELALRNLGLLPDRPGDYTVAAF
jgi:hypothetical protein